MHAPSGGFRYRTSASRRTRGSPTHPRGSARMRGAPNHAKGLEGTPALAQRTIGRRRSPLNFTEFRVVPWGGYPQPDSCVARHPVILTCEMHSAPSRFGARISTTHRAKRTSSAHRQNPFVAAARYSRAITGNPCPDSLRRHTHHSKAQRFESPWSWVIHIRPIAPLSRLSRQTRVRERLTRRSNG